MKSKAELTYDKLLREGLHLLSRDGLEGVTLGRLADSAGLSKSGVFAHFRSKDAVHVALLDHAARVGAAHVVEPAMRAAEGLPRLEALVRHWFGWAPRAGLPGGCPMAAALFELDDIEGPVRDKVLAMEAEWLGLLAQHVRAAVDRGHLRAGLDVDQFVFELCGIYLSHHTAQRFRRAADSDARAAAAFDALVERARPAPAPPKKRRK